MVYLAELLVVVTNRLKIVRIHARNYAPRSAYTDTSAYRRRRISPLSLSLQESDSVVFSMRCGAVLLKRKTRGQSNLTKSASRGAHSPVRGHPRGSKVVPLNSWGRVSY